MSWFAILKDSENTLMLLDTVKEILGILDDYAEMESGKFLANQRILDDDGDYFNVEINPTDDNIEDLIAATEFLMDEWPEQQRMMRIYLDSKGRSPGGRNYSDMYRVVNKYQINPKYWMGRMEKDTPKLKALISRLKAEMKE